MPLLAVRSLYEAGAGAIDVTVNLTGVAADPQIGTGTVFIGAAVVTPPVEELVAGRNWYWPQEVTVYLTGVAASPEVGRVTPVARGTLDDLERMYPFPRRDIEVPKPYTAPRRVAPEQAPPPSVVVGLSGVKSVPIVGTGTVKRVFELLEDEILALLEAA